MDEKEINPKQIREQKGITLVEIHAETKIPLRLLKAIEELKFDELPEPPFARNLIKSYLKYTGIDSVPLLEFYEEYISSARKEEKISLQEIGTTSHASNSLPLWMMGIIVFLTLFGAVLFYIFTDHPPQIPSGPPAPQVPSSVATEPLEEKKAEMMIKIDAQEPTWIRIKVDDELPSEITLRPGETIARTASASIQLDIGNAGGVEVIFQGKSLGKLGKSGEVVHLKFP